MGSVPHTHGGNQKAHQKAYHSYQRKKKVRSYFKEKFEINDERPGIYIQEFMDSDGNPLTLRDTAKFLDVLSLYGRRSNKFSKDEWKILNKIDDVGGSEAVPRDGLPRPERRFLCGKKDAPIEARRQILREFVRLNRERLRIAHTYLEPDDHMPMAWAVVGWAKSPLGRMAEHKMQRNSNWFLNLMEDIAACYPRLSKYKRRLLVIFSLTQIPEACLMEIFFTYLCDGFAKTGGGFAVHAPGINNDSVYSIQDSEWTEPTSVPPCLDKNWEVEQKHLENLDTAIKQIENETPEDLLRGEDFQLGGLEDIKDLTQKLQTVVRSYGKELDFEVRGRLLFTRL